MRGVFYDESVSQCCDGDVVTGESIGTCSASVITRVLMTAASSCI